MSAIPDATIDRVIVAMERAKAEGRLPTALFLELAEASSELAYERERATRNAAAAAEPLNVAHELWKMRRFA
jgi:hypothetical protein